jgi:hypothetical protein
LNVTTLDPCDEPKLEPLMVTLDPTRAADGDRLVAIGGTTNMEPLLASPPTVTTTLPVAAPGGTGATIADALQPAGVVATPLNATLLPPCALPNDAPLIVTSVPTGPTVGERLAMLGTTLNGTALLATPPTETTTGPLDAADGTVTEMLEPLHVSGVAGMPLNETVLAPWTDPKFAPVIVTGVPTGAADGETCAMTGGTVNGTLLLARPRTVTTTGPVVAAAGTDAVMVVDVHALAAAGAPVNVTVLEPWVVPNPDPLIVTVVPTIPDCGDTPPITGGGIGNGARTCES